MYSRKNNLGHHIVEKTDLPDELIKDVAGTLGFQDTQPRVRTPKSLLIIFGP